MLGFEEIEHTADRAFRVTGRDMASLLENAVRAMHSLNAPRPSDGPLAERQIEVEGGDRESLLVNWLNEILYVEQSQRLICEQVHIDELENHHLRARVKLREYDRDYTHIKAVTFHNLEIRETDKGLEAELVLDV